MDEYASDNPPLLLTPGEASRRIGISMETLRRWEREGKSTPIRTPGGHRRYDPAIIDALVARPGRNQ
jgi:excisionase family DNA binding protein